MSEPWNRDEKKEKSEVDPVIKVVVAAALIWSAAMVGLGTCIKNAQRCVNSVRTRYNRKVDREE